MSDGCQEGFLHQFSSDCLSEGCYITCYWSEVIMGVLVYRLETTSDILKANAQTLFCIPDT